MSTAMINAFIDSDEDDDGNFYDKVASDEEYSSLTHQEQQQQKRSRMHRKLKKVDMIHSVLFEKSIFSKNSSQQKIKQWMVQLQMK